ncbi:MAG: hypothetical protein ACRDQU_12455 [Pseudonocardiaceae bacterium]
MSERILVHVETPGGWVRLGSVQPDEPPGSVTNTTPDGKREVYIFGWIGGRMGVFRSTNGIDIEDGPTREILTTGLDIIAGDLRLHSVQFEVAGRDGTAQVRFTYQPEETTT